jgi:hypothetical protein
MNEERIKEIFSDEAFVKELFSKEDPEEVQKMLADKGIDLSIDEIVTLKDMLEKKLQQAQNGEELAEDDLEEVAGGSGVLAFLVCAAIGLAFVATVYEIGCAASGQRSRW